MELKSCDCLTHCFVFVLTAVGVFYLWMKYQYGYWRRRGVYSPPSTFPFGHIGKSGYKESIGQYFRSVYEKTKMHPYVGLVMIFRKTLVINNLDMAKVVLLKNFDHFQGHGLMSKSESDPLARHLFNLDGEEWKRLRVKLTPTFTSSKMRFMFDTMLSCSKEMISHIDNTVQSGEYIDIKEVIAKFGTDVIGSCAFGIQMNSFKYPDTEFRRMGKRMVMTGRFKFLVDLWFFLAPKTIPKGIFTILMKSTTHFFTNIITETIDQREKSNGRRNDFLQLLIDMKNADEKSDYRLTIEEIIPQVFIFFIAGFETSSTVATYAFLELAKNRHIQDKVQAQIDEVMKNNKGQDISYEILNQMTYLTQIAEESMRMYPPLPVVFRECTKEFRIPDTDTIIEKGTRVIIPALGIHHDPELYPDPSKFDPDRFSPENSAGRNQFSQLYFGEGPRICIGSRFGVMQVKLAMFMILRHFNVVLCEETAVPVCFDVSSVFILLTKGGMKLKFTRRTEQMK